MRSRTRSTSSTERVVRVILTLANLFESREELLRRLESCQPLRGNLVARRIEEHDRRNADNRILLRQFLHLGILGLGEIRFHACEAIKLAGNIAIAEGFLVELLTRDAPVGVE